MGGSRREGKRPLELEIVRVYDVPRARVFAMWTDPAHLARWCHPKDFTVADSGGDVRPSGAWRSRIRGPDGTDYPMAGTYLEIGDGTRLVYTHAWLDDDGEPGHETTITVLFADEGDGTRLTFRQGRFRDPEATASHEEGWSEVLDSLGAYLGRNRP